MNKQIKQDAWDNNITGTYHNTHHWIDYLWMATAVLLVIALPFIIADLIWGAEVVTEWVASLV
jgi:hypothetical protein